MSTKNFEILTILALVLLSACKSPSTKESASSASADPFLWEVAEGLAQPESAYFDPHTQTIFVSNVAGEPTKKDGVGYISQFSKDGKVMNLKWFKGLHAPKGIRTFENKMVVSDIDRVVVIDTQTAKTIYTVTISGAKFLNDTAIDSKGTIYVSDMVGNKIYQIKNRKATALKTNFDLESPNGLLLQIDSVNGDILYVASWGAQIKPDFSTKSEGRLYSINLKTLTQSLITSTPLGHLDGLERLSNGTFLVSDWMAAKIFEVQPSGESRLLMQGFKGSADIGYIEETKTLLVPRMGENKLSAYLLP